MVDSRAMLAEAHRRYTAKAEARAKGADYVARLRSRCFDKQIAVLEDSSRRKAAFCTRRAGKTDCDATALLEAALGGADRIVLFVAKTRQRAVDLTWEPVKKLEALLGLEEHKDFQKNETKFRRTYVNGSEIRWTGADDLDELKKKRGDKLFRVIIDEAQDFDFVILKQLVDDVFGPSLEDLQGDIWLTGTPGEVCAGLWYGLTVTPEEEPDAAKRTRGWSVHRWSVLDNPHMAHMKKRLPEIIREKGNGDYDAGLNDPTVQREWFGKWVRDVGTLFYAFDPKRNLYDPAAVKPWGDGWYHARGWDLGLRDAMALVYWGFRLDGDPNLYEAYSWKASGVLSDVVAKHAEDVERELGLNVIGTAADTGGLGALVVEEVEHRTGMHNDAAKKTDKAGAVRLFNEDLRRGVTKLRPGSPLAQEMAVLPKMKDWDEEKTGKPAPEDPRFPNHCCDGGLYSHRWAKHYLSELEPPKPPVGSPEFYAQQEREMEAQLVEQALAEEEYRKGWGY